MEQFHSGPFELRTFDVIRARTLNAGVFGYLRVTDVDPAAVAGKCGVYQAMRTGCHSEGR
jgi:hypothetical protein